MIKDKWLKIIAIPIVGLLLPFNAGWLTIGTASFIQLAYCCLYFVVVAFFCWQACSAMTASIRLKKQLQNAIQRKLFAILSVVGVVSSGVFFLAAYGWQWVSLDKVDFFLAAKLAATGSIAMLFVTLIYEILYLHAEVDVDDKVIRQLDYERLQAEAKALQNDLDPHFLFNCLNTLSYLVRNEPEKAYQFVHKLSNVFKYLLINKQKDFISLAEEMAFLEDYYFLLRVRFDDAIRINNAIEVSQVDGVLPPYTLQALVENAIKNNFFSEKEPLVISIQMKNYVITVSNTVKPKQYKANGTNAGLAKLKLRYRQLMNMDVLVQETNEHYLVKVPFLQKAQVA